MALREPKNGVLVLLLAVYFDPSLMETARKVAGTDDRFPAWVSVAEALEAQR